MHRHRIYALGSFAILVAVTCGLLATGRPSRSQHVPAPSREAHESQPTADHQGETGPGPPLTLRVTSRRRQRIDGWGATIVSGTVLDPLARPSGLTRGSLKRLDRLVFRDAGINLLRIYGPGFGRSDPNVIGTADDGEGRLSARDGRWRLMRRARSYGVKLLFTASNAPASMKDGKSLAPGSERSFARYVAGNLAFAQRIGAPLDYAAIGNEIDNQVEIIPLWITREQAATVYDELARQIVRRRLRTRLALGDNVNWGRALEYALEALRSAPVRRSARVLASHAYGGDDSRGAVGQAARRSRLSVWMTEWAGGGCPDGSCPDNRSFGFALEWARQIIRDMKDPGVNGWFMLRPVDDSTHGPDSGIIVRTRGGRSPFYRTRRFSLFQQYSSAARPGARRLVVEGDPDALAFAKGRRRSLVVANFQPVARVATLDLGRRAGRLLYRRTSARERFRALAARDYPGSPVRMVLPAQSVSTLTLVQNP